MSTETGPWLLRLGAPPEPDAPAPDAPALAPPAPPGGPARGALPPDTLGLALAGGGIRSATFCLGVIQALARAGWLRHVDFLSTVSGGGYTGGFLGRFFDLSGKRDGVTGAIPTAAGGAGQERVARDLVDSRSEPITWLRRHSNYLSPTGHGEFATNLAAFWRNLTSVYVVLAALLLAAFGALNAIAYWYPEGPAAAAIGEVVAAVTPITGAFQYRTPWAVLAELVVWLAVLPLGLAYWLVSQDLPETFLAPVLVAAALVAGAALVGGMSPLGLVVLAAAVLWSLAVWNAVRRDEGHNDPFNPTRLALARNVLTGWLTWWLGAALGLAAFAALDGLGRWLAWRMLQGGLTVPNVTEWFASVGGAVFGLVAALRAGLRFLVGESPRGASALAFSRPLLVGGLVVLLGAVPPLVGLAFVSHAAYALGDRYTQGLLFTGLVLAVSLLLGLRACVAFINRSSPMGIYASRLGRAFLGAVNPARRVHPDGPNVTHVVTGDDVPLAQYAPEAAGGPLHLINCAVNESIDVASQRGQRDRQAENLALGPAGVSVARGWHALWVPGGEGRALAPLADPREDKPHPFLAVDGRPAPVEGLSLQQAMAISGAAVGPGMGRRTNRARALLLTLVNFRLGYWWDSGLNAAERANVARARGVLRLWRRLLRVFSTLFQSQALLLAELTGRFAGPWERYWNLSDGGHFENTGAYELLRRRVPFVILCDAGEDPQRYGADLARLVRVARVDLGAEVADVSPAAAAAAGAPDPIVHHLGALADLLASPARAHAALLLVRYPEAPAPAGDPWLGRTHTWVLYLKATVTGDEPADVLSYAVTHPDFPNEPTLDQMFDEPQWESYRALGAHIGGNLFR
ncbi:hypothetical protein R5W23_000471 [Gemmata sp. JC673]|uniref:PNPLA domain-containing protein n=1 Tax=Gemmata algarum TaxID=2975278 RepID=A0ABU5EX13_9BACT|nr:hypothetical protein [Gemmata algarum]MDY3559478.1 hypothetical protein [Gemmata algarum]